MNVKIADRLVELRRKNGLSQEELADKLNLSRQAVSKWERAESSPDTDNLIKLAQIYSISLDELLHLDEDDLNDLNNTTTIEQQQANECNHEKEQMRHPFFDLPFVFGIAILYLCLGFCLDLWHPAWLLFLVIPFVYMILGAVDAYKESHDILRTAECLPIPIFVVAGFFTLGIVLNAWHPGWILFLLIPAYYCFIGFLKKCRDYKSQKK